MKAFPGFVSDNLEDLLAGRPPRGFRGPAFQPALADGGGVWQQIKDAQAAAAKKVQQLYHENRARSGGGGDPREQPGRVTGGANLRPVTGKWFQGSHGNYARIPKQVADRLRQKGTFYRNLREFREDFWRTVGEFPELLQGFSPSNQSIIKGGNAPFVHESQAIGEGDSAQRYLLHHERPLQHGGGVYDLDNVFISTPRYHLDVLDPKVHYGTREIGDP